MGIGKTFKKAVHTTLHPIHAVKSGFNSAKNLWSFGTGMDATEASTKEQMEFQERMRNTAYQASMADMEKAGLNPILAYKQGGASTPSGSSFTAPNNISTLADAGSKLTNSVIAKKKFNSEMLILDAERKRISAAGLKLMKERSILDEQLKVYRSQVPSLINNATFEAEHPSLYKTERMLGIGLPAVNSAMGLIGGGTFMKAILGKTSRSSAKTYRSGNYVLKPRQVH